MASYAELRAGLGASMAGADRASAMAHRLCAACVQLLDVDGAAVSLMLAGTTYGTVGASSDLSRRLDELQFTFGEGPCADAVRQGRPVLVEDLADPLRQRWPAYTAAALADGVHAVYALPISVAGACVGALDLYRHSPGALLGPALLGGLMAAELAALPLLNLRSGAADLEEAAEGGQAWDQLTALARVEVYQATGMLMAQLQVGPTDALARLRAHAFAHDLTASDVAWAILERRLRLEPDREPPGPDAPAGSRT